MNKAHSLKKQLYFIYIICYNIFICIISHNCWDRTRALLNIGLVLRISGSVRNAVTSITNKTAINLQCNNNTEWPENNVEFDVLIP